MQEFKPGNVVFFEELLLKPANLFSAEGCPIPAPPNLIKANRKQKVNKQQKETQETQSKKGAADSYNSTSNQTHCQLAQLYKKEDNNGLK